MFYNKQGKQIDKDYKDYNYNKIIQQSGYIIGIKLLLKSWIKFYLEYVIIWECAVNVSFLKDLFIRHFLGGGEIFPITI